MRLKEDKDSWRSSGIIKRDYKHDNSEPTRIVFKKKKNTNLWCRGRVGVEHDYVLTENHNQRYYSWKKYVCRECKKHKHNYN